jgi:hypothetical protein
MASTAAAAAQQGRQEPDPGVDAPGETRRKLEVFGGLGGASVMFTEGTDLGSATAVDLGVRYRATPRWGVSLRLTTSRNVERWQQSEHVGSSWSIRDPLADRWFTPNSVHGRMTLVMVEASLHSTRKTIAPYVVLGLGVGSVKQTFESLEGGKLTFDDSATALSIGPGVAVNLSSDRLGISPELRIVATSSGPMRPGYLGVQGLVVASYRF